MATIVAGHTGYCTVGGLLLSGTVASEFALHLSADELEASTIGQNWKEFMQGQAEATLDASGVWDSGTAALRLDAILFGMVNAGGTKLYEFLPAGSTTNQTKYTGNCLCTGYEITNPVGGVVGFTAAFRGAGSVTRSLVT